MESQGRSHPAVSPRNEKARKKEVAQYFDKVLAEAPQLSSLVAAAAQDYKTLVQEVGYDLFADACGEAPRVLTAFREWLARLPPPRRADLAMYMFLQFDALERAALADAPLSSHYAALAVLAGPELCEPEVFRATADALEKFDKKQPELAASVEDYITGRMFPHDGHAGVGGDGEPVG